MNQDTDEKEIRFHFDNEVFILQAQPLATQPSAHAGQLLESSSSTTNLTESHVTSLSQVILPAALSTPPIINTTGNQSNKEEKKHHPSENCSNAHVIIPIAPDPIEHQKERIKVQDWICSGSIFVRPFKCFLLILCCIPASLHYVCLTKKNTFFMFTIIFLLLLLLVLWYICFEILIFMFRLVFKYIENLLEWDSFVGFFLYKMCEFMYMCSNMDMFKFYCKMYI